ncbi:hypothetical protein U1Q18_029508 [Sarracenia purpurea var. burkii]
MCSSMSPSSLALPTITRIPFRRCNYLFLSSSHPIPINRRAVNPKSCLSASVAERNLEISWFSPEQIAVDDYGGWAIVEAPTLKKKNGLPPFLLVGIGASVAALLAAIAHFSLSRRGLAIKFSSPLHALYGVLRLSAPNKDVVTKNTDFDASRSDAAVPEPSLVSVSDAAVETAVLETKHLKRQEGKLGRIFIPVAVDLTQQEALCVLKKLKIVEDDVKAEELCTRREYARWLVRTNSLLESNPKHRIVPSIALLGSMFAAFDDVSIEDPDFHSIQSLAEAGIVLSKLSGKNSSSDQDDSEVQDGVCFFPDRFISRQDLIDWKSQLEYEVKPGINEKMSKTDMDFMDTREISSDVSPELFMDMLAGEKSILKRVFGQGKRFQPNKPSTKAQAAVALTSGKMTEAIRAELSRLEVENSLRQTAMEDIRSDFLNKGDIQRYWDGKLEEERTRVLDVEKFYLAAKHDLEEENIVQANTRAQYLKEKAAMDCQKQLLFSLKEEVNEMSKRLACEKAQHADEQRILHGLIGDLDAKLEGIFDAKSILEAEIEALRILRSWIEDQARKSQASAKVLEEVGRRWKWDE